MTGLRSLLLPASAAGVGFLLLAPEATQAFVLTGFSLPKDQRQFRVFNNFADAAANDNAAAEPNYPGYTGATAAIWKGVSEWGSTLHGDGSGDPTQPGDLGSGGANFDPFFLGGTDSPGDVASNTFSAVTGLGSLLYIIEGDGSGAWRARFNDDLLWDDGPTGTLEPGALDLQGLTTRAYGTILGLGNSSVPGSVMAPTIVGDGVALRDLGADDQAGVQAIYGSKSLTKPVITDVEVSGTTVTITGSNFDPLSNEVWFARDFPTISGEVLKVTGVVSGAGGTLIVLGIPAGAGDGDVQVHTGPGNAGVSNAWPLDVETSGGPLAITGVLPAVLPALTPTNDYDFAVSGSGFNDVLEVRLNGVALDTIPAAWTATGDTLIRFDLAPLAEYDIATLGSYLLTVQTVSDAASIAVPFEAPELPVMRVASGAAEQSFVSFFPATFHLGGTPDNVMLVWASLKEGFTPFPGFFELGIGDFDFSSLVLADIQLVGDNGNVTYEIALPSGLAGLTVYWQAVEYDPATGALPLPATNVGETPIVF